MNKINKPNETIIATNRRIVYELKVQILMCADSE